MKRFNHKNYSTFRKRLRRILEFGIPGNWFRIEDKNGGTVLVCEIVDPSEISNLEGFRKWDITSVHPQKLDKPFLAISARGSELDKLLMVFEKDETISLSALAEMKESLRNAYRYDVSGSRLIFPDQRTDSKIFILLLFGLVGMALVFNSR